MTDLFQVMFINVMLLLNVFLNYLLIPGFGLVGAAVGTVLGLLLSIVASLTLSRPGRLVGASLGFTR